MSVSRVGVPVIYMFGDPPEPYRIRYGDQYQCPLCGKMTINGMSEKGTEHFEKDFKKEVEQIKKTGFPVIVWERIKDAVDVIKQRYDDKVYGSLPKKMLKHNAVESAIREIGKKSDQFEVEK
jgi:hypothetical protein